MPPLLLSSIKTSRQKPIAASIQMFNREYVKTGLVGQEMGLLLLKAFDLRQMSDYDIAAGLDQNNVEEIVLKAREFVEKLKEILGIK